jgi:hypothetical protein
MPFVQARTKQYWMEFGRYVHTYIHTYIEYTV